MEPHGEFVLQYLGSEVLAKATSSGLGTIQKPLRDRYFEFKKHSGKKHKSKDLREVALHVNDRGVAVIVAGTPPGSELYYDMQSISFYEAVRFTTVKTHDKKYQGGFVPIDINRAPNTGSEKLFTPLDKKHSNLAKVEHPPLLALVMRKNTGVRALECHGFVCDNENQALDIVSLIAMLQSPRMDSGRHEFMRPPSDPNFEREPPSRRPDLLQPAEDQRLLHLTDEHLRGPRPGEWRDYRSELEGPDRYPRDPYGPPGPREEYSQNLSSSGRFDSRFPPQSYEENIRYRHEREHSSEYQRQPPGEFHHVRQSSNEIRHDRPPSDYRYERQPSMEYRHERQPSSELQHERKVSSEFRHERNPSSEFRHERQLSSEYRHERQGSGDFPRGERYSRDSYDSGERRGRLETRNDDYKIPRVMSPGRVPPATAPKPSRALSPGPRSPMEDRYLGNEPPIKRGLPRTPTTVDEPHFPSPTRDRPPSFKGPEYSASSLESRQEMENQKSKPVARVPPHLVAGVKVLPTGFMAALQKKQEENKSPRSPKQERYAEEDPYDNAMSRKEFYERESKYDRDYNPNAPPDLVPRGDYDDYDHVIRRDQGSYYQPGPGNYRHSAPPEGLDKPQKPWSYDEQFQKYAQDKNQNRSSEPHGGEYRQGEMADMFSKMNVQNPNKRPEVLDTAGTNFEQSLGYFP
ncbi:uncharacterized protein LOC134260146 [Saccostrea cucullata]|uniref:uncharacterized protein LOC134260146 n=1 Tax=Saccostrea cuccullata TaxID=36930 RepID=UPI002ED3E7C8